MSAAMQPSVSLSGEVGPLAPANAQYRPVPQPAKATAPLVIVEGFLSYTSEFWWGDFATHLNGHRVKVGSKKRREIIFARVGPANSAHDRACELFYSLKGGTVDYGEQHSSENGHRRFGRNYSIGLYPSWSVDHPLHLLGHSMGGVTVVKMMTLISEGFFPNAHPDMIASINSVGSPFRGTQLGYWMSGGRGESPGFRRFSLSSFVSRYLHLISYFSPILPSGLVPDLHNESRNLTMRDMSIWGLIKQLYRSDWAETKDATPWDCTFAAADVRDDEFERFRKQGMNSSSRTWYRSYCMSYTSRTDTPEPHHAPSLAKFITSPPLWLTSLVMGNYDLTNLNPLPRFLTRRLRLPLSTTTSRSSSLFSSSFSSVTSSPSLRSRSIPNESHQSGMETDSTLTDQQRQRLHQRHRNTLEFSDDDDLVPPSYSSKASSTVAALSEDEFQEIEEFLGQIRLAGSDAAPSTAHPALREHHFENDGVVPIFSQWHPGNCDDSRCIHYNTLNNTARLPTSHLHAKQIPRPGVWNVITINDSHHLSLMPMWVGSMKQRTFWYGLGEWLEEVDAARMYMSVMDGSNDVRVINPAKIISSSPGHVVLHSPLATAAA